MQTNKSDPDHKLSSRQHKPRSQMNTLLDNYQLPVTFHSVWSTLAFVISNCAERKLSQERCTCSADYQGTQMANIDWK